MMNLYKVYPYGDEWCCFVFAETRGKAKTRMAGHFDDENDFLAFGVRIAAKDVGGPAQVCDENCERLEALGVRYYDEETDE